MVFGGIQALEQHRACRSPAPTHVYTTTRVKHISSARLAACAASTKTSRDKAPTAADAVERHVWRKHVGRKPFGKAPKVNECANRQSPRHLGTTGCYHTDHAH